MTAKFRINGKDYTWSSLNRLPKERLLAEAQKLGSTVDSTTTWTKADLADLVIYLSDKKSSAIFDYWQNYTGGWVRVGETGIVEVEDFSETVIYDRREDAADDLLLTIREWAKDDADARKFLVSIDEMKKPEIEINTKQFESVEPCYTGGGIYVFAGKLADGNWFIANDDYGVIKVNAPVDWDESFYMEWIEAHLVEELPSADCLKFFKSMLAWVKVNKPDGNYSMAEMDYIEDDLDECIEAEANGIQWR